MAFSETIMAMADKITKGAFKTKDPNNVDSQLSKGDLADPPPQDMMDPPWGKAADLVSLGKMRYEDSRQAFWKHHAGTFFTGVAMYDGKQHQVWNDEAQAMRPAVGANDNPDMVERFDQMTTNIIRAKTELMMARVLAMWPDAWVAPMTGSDQDKGAASVASAVTAHAARVINLTQIIEDALLACAVGTSCFVELGWDKNADADLGIPQPDGTIKYIESPVGEVDAALLLAIDAYPDPNSSMTGCIHDGAYFIKRCTYTTTFIKRKWGVDVEATCRADNYGFLRQRLEWLAGDFNSAHSGTKDSADVMQVWERPSPQYRKGRFWVQCNDTLLYGGWWPYKQKKRYPFVKFGYRKNLGSVWDLNFVGDLVDTQIELNGLNSYLYGRQMWDRPVEYVSDRSNIAPNDLLNKSYGRTVAFDAQGGPAPSYSQPPPPGQFYFNRRQNLLDDADIISGVRDLNASSENQTQPVSGFQYDLMLQEDRTRLGPVIRHVSRNVVEIYEWIIDLYEQYGISLPRVLGLDDRAIAPGGEASVLADISALKNGRCRVVLNAGSGEGKLPAAQEEWLEKFVTTAAHNNVPPPLLEFWLEQTQWIRSDAAVDKLLANYKAWFAQQQAQAAQLQAQKGSQAQNMIQLKGQQEQQAAQIEEQVEQTRAAIEVDAEGKKQTLRSQSDQAIENNRSLMAMALEEKKFEHQKELQDQRMAQPTVSYSVSLPGKLGPKGIAGTEEKLGLPTDDPGDLMKVLVPPKPNAPPKGGSSGKAK